MRAFVSADDISRIYNNLSTEDILEYALIGSVLKKCVSPYFSYLCISKKIIKNETYTFTNFGNYF